MTLSQAVKTNRHGVPSYYDSNVTIPFQSIITRQNSLQSRFRVSQACIRNKSQVSGLWPDFEMMVSPLKLTVPSGAPKNIAVRLSKSLEDREVGKQFAPVWKVLAEKLEVLFLEKDDTGAFIVPALDARSQVLSIKDRRNGVGKPEFKLAPFGSAQLFTLVAPDLCVPGVSPEVLQRVISHASTANV